jgi:hypothetical protein
VHKEQNTMRMRRNQPSSAVPADAACPSCHYDELFATAQAVAIAGTFTLTLEPEFSSYFCPQYVDTVVMDAAVAENNSRAGITGVTIRGCSQLLQDEAQAVASPAIVIPDMWSRSAECCLGTPICWGAFGQSGLSQELNALGVNLSGASSIDVYFHLVGRASDTPGLWPLGKRCTDPR